MATRFDWVEGPLPGKLTRAARPRGGDWLDDEIAGGRRAGVDVLLSLLTADEEREFDLKDRARKNTSMEYIAFPHPGPTSAGLRGENLWSSKSMAGSSREGTQSSTAVRE